MQLVCPTNIHTCIPVRIADGPGCWGAWLGGRPPAGLVPPQGMPMLRYFCTVPLCAEPKLCVSVFVADLEPLMEVRGKVNEVGDFLMPIIHSPTPRQSVPSASDSTLSEHSLVLLDSTEDWEEGDDGHRVIRPGHKIGGRPHLIRERPALVASLGEALKNGYLLIAQFDFPSHADAIVSGDWPFADGLFILLGREPFQKMDWRWYWDF